MNSRKPTKPGTNTRNKRAQDHLKSSTSTAFSRNQSDAVSVLKRELEEKIAGLTTANRQLKRKIFDLYTIFDISRNFNAVLDYEQLLDTFIYTSLAQVGASKAAIYLDQGRRDGAFTLAKHKGSGEFPGPEQYFEVPSVLVSYLTRLNRPSTTVALMNDIANESEKQILSKYHPGLAVPLIYQSRLSGILMITDKMSGREFSIDDIEFLSILGNQISVAIENTRLYEAEKLASQQLRATQQQLVHSERLAALGEMSAKVAHEINNPLGIVKNYLLLLQQNVADRNEALGYAEIVSQEIDRIARIVRELLDFHRPTGIQFQQTDVAKVMSDVLLLMERQLESKNITVIKHFDPKCPPVEASPEGLKQVFLNIVINASDAMNDGGTLRVHIGCDGDYLSIEICDTGPGIKPEIIPRIFEPFFTTKEPGKGTGLGLSVCYGIVKKHRGTISYKNLEKGGCFEVKLPIKTNSE